MILYVFDRVLIGNLPGAQGYRGAQGSAVAAQRVGGDVR